MGNKSKMNTTSETEAPKTVNEHADKVGPRSIFKIQPTKENTGTFLNVPREYV